MIFWRGDWVPWQLLPSSVGLLARSALETTSTFHPSSLCLLPAQPRHCPEQVGCTASSSCLSILDLPWPSCLSLKGVCIRNRAANSNQNSVDQWYRIESPETKPNTKVEKQHLQQVRIAFRGRMLQILGWYSSLCPSFLRLFQQPQLPLFSCCNLLHHRKWQPYRSLLFKST